MKFKGILVVFNLSFYFYNKVWKYKFNREERVIEKDLNELNMWWLFLFIY